MTKSAKQLEAEIAEALATPMKYYRVTLDKSVATDGPRRFWMRVIRETPKAVVGWELTSDGDRTHRQHVIERAAATFEPARMNTTYATMELL